MIRPDRSQLAQLTPFERVAFEVCDVANRNRLLKDWAHVYLRTFGAGWVHFFTQHVRHVAGLERIPAGQPDRGVVLVSNHRSFFDLYVVSCVLLRERRWVERMYFPVRSSYFYERPDGIVVNGIMSALAMYPPVLRDDGRRGFNQYMVDVLAEQLGEPGTLIGIHPEGTRSKSDDPYTLLPVKSGVGQILHKGRGVALPVFVNGLLNDFPKQLLSNWDGTGEPVVIVFGEPVPLDDLYEREGTPETHQAIADRLKGVLEGLGQEEKALRANLGLPPFPRR